MPHAKADAYLSLSSTPQIIAKITVPGDKSISHRAIILGSLAKGTTKIRGFLRSEDCLATLNIMRQLGVQIDDDGEYLTVHGVGLDGLKAPDKDLDCGNAGTAMRLLAGVLAAQNFSSTLIGDASLTRRPMQRIIKPLTLMGANITADNGTAPLHFSPSQQWQAIDYQSPIASAQVKSAVLLGGLYAAGTTTVSEPNKSRNHSETMLQGFGAEIAEQQLTVSLTGRAKLQGQAVQVPADISSAAFFMVLAAIHPTADLTIEKVGINPTRDGIIRILQKMGANLELLNIRQQAGEPIADIRITSSKLQGIDIPSQWIAASIDEFPIVFVAAAMAEGQTTLRKAEELRHKESDRIAVMIEGLQRLGITCEQLPDGVIINGSQSFQSATVDGHGDHRCAMSFLVASAVSPQAEITVSGCHNINTSFPDFFELMNGLGCKTQPFAPVITVDGPSGVGKGTISKLLAEYLDWHLLDSGAIYRAAALQVLQNGASLQDQTQIIAAIDDLDLTFQPSSQTEQSIEVLLSGQAVNQQLRSEECAAVASKIAAMPAVRAALLQRQKDFRQLPGLIADGRDMGTVVFKNAVLKLFLTASAAERAKRRHKQLQRQGVMSTIPDLLEDIEARDLRDSSRQAAPLKPADDAIVIDTDDLSIDQLFNQVKTLVDNILV